MLRVEALLRRACRTQGMASGCAGEKDLGTREIGDLRVDVRHGDVWRRGEKIALSPKERRIMATLAEHPGETFDRNDLIRLVWGEEYLNTSISIPVYMRKLREKIEDDPSDPRYLQTVWGLGYRLGD